MTDFLKRVRILGVLLALAGLGLAGGGFAYGMPQALDGLASAEQMYEAQGVELKYDTQGQLLDRGDAEAARRIMSLLTDDWQYPANPRSFDPHDSLVNTRDELMYQYATITYHTLQKDVAVKLSEDDVPITYRGVTYDTPGTYNISVAKYYAELDRSNPIERQLRAAWGPEVLALTGALSSGHANQAAGELAAATTLGIGGIGVLFILAGAGVVWASFAKKTVRSGTASRELAEERVQMLLER